MDTSELAAGIAAGLAQDVLLHPLDTVRARLDTGATSAKALNPVSALAHEARAVVLSDGVVGLYRGYALCLTASAPANALYFGSYRATRRALPDGLPFRDAAAGFGAELLASLLWTPLDVVKQRLQVAPPETSALDAARSACALGGPLGLWRGYWAGIAVWGPYSAVYFSAFEAIRRALGGSSDDVQSAEGVRTNLASGVGAGALGALATQPLDCAKTRIQVGATPGATQPGLLATVRAVWAAEGARALWRGAFARVMWLAPGCAVSITVFEYVASALKVKRTPAPDV